MPAILRLYLKVLCHLVACLVATTAAPIGSTLGANTTVYSINTNQAVQLVSAVTLQLSSAKDTSPTSTQPGIGQGDVQVLPAAAAQQNYLSAAVDPHVQLESIALHKTRQLVVLSTIFPKIAATSRDLSKITQTSSTDHRHQDQPQQQQQQQRLSIIKIKASICPIPQVQTDSPSSVDGTYDICHKAASIKTQLAQRPVSPDYEPKPLRVALLLPAILRISSMSSAATGPSVDSRGQPMLLTIHVEQRGSGCVYLWTTSQLILPGVAVVTITANMSDSVYSWPIRHSVLPKRPTAAAEAVTAPTMAAEAVTAPTAASSMPTIVEDKANSTGDQMNYSDTPNDIDSATNISENAAKVCRIENVGSKDFKREQQQQWQQQHERSAPSAASICPALQQHLSTCAAASAATTTYAVMGMLDSNPNQAAWVAATLMQSKHVQQLLRKQQGQSQPHTSNSDSSGSDGRDGERRTCTAWPVEPGLGLVKKCPAAAADVAVAPEVEAAGAAAVLQDSNGDNSRDSSTGGRACWAVKPSYFEVCITCNICTHSFKVLATPGQVLLVLAGLLLVTVAGCAVICSSRRCKSAAAAAVIPAAVPAAQGLVQIHELRQMECDSCNKQQCSRQLNKDQFGTDEDLMLFGRSALDLLDQQQQQQLDSFGDVDQDDYTFGYGGPAAAATSHGIAEAAAKAVRRASSAAAGQVTAVYQAALGNAAAAAAPRHSSLSPSGGPRPNTAAAAMQNTTAAMIPSTAAKLAAGYWDSADEDAVNKLPANIQEHLQAGGQWTRDAGGRLIRGSMKALRAASNRAAAAVSAALSAGAAADMEQQQWTADAGLSGDHRHANLLRRLVAAESGAEIASSDDEN